jgi:hypothetical protein
MITIIVGMHGKEKKFNSLARADQKGQVFGDWHKLKNEKRINAWLAFLGISNDDIPFSFCKSF